MQTSAQKVVSGLSRIKEVYASDNLAPIKVEVKWVRGTNVARYMETEAAIEKALEREVALPPSKFRPPWDPRVSARSKQFRDNIRRSLKCQELGLDLQAILIRYDHAAEDEFGHTDGFSQDGKDIKETFDNPQYSNFVLDVRLEPFDMDHDMFVSYEYEGDPIGQDTYLAMQNSQKIIPIVISDS
jgi:hypothetical protein